MNRKNIAIIGQIGSGKTSLMKSLEEDGYKKVVTYTTRPRRDGEENGKDYFFITEYEFLRKAKEGIFAETTSYRTIYGKWYYGSKLTGFDMPRDKAIILNPFGIPKLPKSAFVVYLNPPIDTLIQRAQIRGDDSREILRRLCDDAPAFRSYDNMARSNLIITDPNYSPETIKKIIFRKLKLIA